LYIDTIRPKKLHDLNVKFSEIINVIRKKGKVKVKTVRYSVADPG
jgi:hypothetical protein